MHVFNFFGFFEGCDTQSLFILRLDALVQPRVEVSSRLLFEDGAETPRETVEEERVDPQVFVADRLLEEVVVVDKAVIGRLNLLLLVRILFELL